MNYLVIDFNRQLAQLSMLQLCGGALGLYFVERFQLMSAVATLL
jgi:hypothetical protein